MKVRVLQLIICLALELKISSMVRVYEDSISRRQRFHSNNVVSLQDNHGRTSLQAAVEGGQAEAVKLLLELGASLETRDRRGHRALHHAILADSPDMVGHLLDLGAARDAKDSTRLTYFQFALLKRKFTALEALVV